MPTLNDKEFFKSIKTSPLQGVYLLCGAEQYFIKKAELELRGKAVIPAMESFNYVLFDGERLNISELEDACEGLPIMADYKYVAVKNCDFDKLLKDDFARLTALIEDLPETSVLVLYQTGAPFDLKKSTKCKKLWEQVSKKGAACEFPFKDKLTLKRALHERAKKAGVVFEPETAGVLIDRCSNDFSVLANETDKLIAYCKGISENANSVEITSADIDQCCIASIEGSAFELAKSILSGRFDRAYEKLADLFFLRQDAVAIAAALTLAFSDIYRARTALDSGVSSERVQVDFKYPKNRLFAVKNAFRDSRGFKPEQLRACINALYQADIQLKSSKLDNRLILEQMLGKMQLRFLK